MLADNITVNTRTYALIGQTGQSSMRSIAGLPSGRSRKLAIAHEESTKGIRSSALIITDSMVVNSAVANPVTDTAKVIVKFTYKPLGGRTDTRTALIEALQDAISILSVTENQDKFLNQES